MTSELVATVIEMILMIVFSIVGGVVICWQQSILVFILSPIIIGGTVAAMRMQWAKNMQGKADEKADKDDQEALDEDKANAVISDIILNYRTVISFGQKNVDQVILKYKNLCTTPLNRKLRKLFWAGGTNGWSNAGRITFVALSFTLGNIITV